MEVKVNWFAARASRSWYGRSISLHQDATLADLLEVLSESAEGKNLGTSLLGRADLISIQVQGALENKELTVEQLDEVLLQLAFYVGWGNATAVSKGIATPIEAYNGKGS
ncbi:MAG: hypothetical protein EPO21_05555 [Chloroflexota bacterium]|nr:MAG: hypothetical protein EPO21_05555 [Chloroflexota bacterium]